MKGKIIIGLFMCLMVTATMIFVVLKLLDVINWGWAWVIAPVWVPALILLTATLIAMIIGVFTNFKE